MAVFYRKDAEKSWVLENLSGNTQTQLDKLQGELERAKDIGEKRLIREQILSLRRELNQAKQFTSISESKLVEWKNNLDSISAADLMRLDREVSKEKRWEFLSKSFLYKRTTNSDGDTFEEPVEHSQIREWDTLYVDFGKNKSAESKIGVGDFLSMNTKVVKIIDQNGNIRVGKRSIQWNKVGYYDEQWYIAVYNWYKVEIPKVSESEEYLKKSNPSIPLSSSLDDENKAKDTFIETAKKYEQLGEAFSPWNIIEKQKFQTKATELAKKVETDYGIPWQVTYGQATLETGYGKSAPNNNYFGIKWPGWEFKTKEMINGKEIEVTASFRWYTSMEESFDAYGKFLTTTSLYQSAFSYKDNPDQFLYEIWKLWYATDPLYVDKVKSIWWNYDKIKNFKLDTSEITGRTTPDSLIRQAQQYLWTEYTWWGNSEYGIDCSHLVCKSLSDLWIVKPSFYRVAADLRNLTPTKSLNDIQRGDLIFWHGWDRWVSHVAIASWSPMGWTINIIDASWKISWLWRVAERTIPLTDKLSAGTPPFYS